MESGWHVFAGYLPYLIGLLVVRVLGHLLYFQIRKWWRR